MQFAGFLRRCAAHILDLAWVCGGLMLVFSANLAWQGVSWAGLQCFWLRTVDELDYMLGLLVTFWVAVFSGMRELFDFFDQTTRVDPLDSFNTLGVYVCDGLGLLAMVAILQALGDASSRQASLGKQLMGLQIVDLMGRRLRFGHALVRAALGAGNYAVFGLAYLWMFVSPRRQAAHDYASGALVVTQMDIADDARLYPTWSA